MDGGLRDEKAALDVPGLLHRGVHDRDGQPHRDECAAGDPPGPAPAVTAPVAGLLSDRLGGRRIVAIGVALQAIGIGWLAAEITPTIPYAELIPPFLIAGTGLGFFFAPITRLTLSYAPEQLEGIASGTSNALRQVGTVLGVSVLGSVFSAAGGLGSPGQFTTGLIAALTVSAAILGASALVVLLAPETRTARQAAAAGAGASLAVPRLP
jgi:MFS family permease